MDRRPWWGWLAAPVLLAALAGCGGCGSPPAAPPAAAPVSLTIYHFNDFHAAFRPIGHIGEDGEVDGEWSGAAGMAGYVKKFRAADADCLLLFGGDMLLANPIDSRTQGAATVKLLNLLKPDAACVGNHEFDYGRPRLEELAADMQYPLLAANLADAGGSLLFKASTVVEKKGLRILVIGLFPVSGKRYYEEDHDLKISEALAAVKKAVAAATGDNDLTIVLSHLGRDEDEILAKALPASAGVDLIVGAHTHETIAEIDAALPVPVVQAGANGEYFGHLALKIDPERNRIISVDQYELIPTMVAGVDPDPAAQALVRAELKHLAPMLTPLAALTAPLPFTRSAESALGNFLADAFAAQFSADLAFFDSKWQRRYLAGPEITECDVREVLPGSAELVEVSMRADGLRGLLEYNLRKNDRFLAVSAALRCTWRGNRLGEMTFNGQPLDPQRAYSVIVERTMAERMAQFNGGEIIGSVSSDAAASLIAYLKKARTVAPPATGRVALGGARAQRAAA